MNVRALWWGQIGAVACAYSAQLVLLLYGADRNEHVANAIVYLGIASLLPYATYLAASRSSTVRSAARASECAAAGASIALLIQVWMGLDLWLRAETMTMQNWAHSIAWVPWVSAILGAGASLFTWALVWIFQRFSARS